MAALFTPIAIGRARTPFARLADEGSGRPRPLGRTRRPPPSPRPNPIALTTVELIKRDGPRLEVRGVDMLDGTPILDIKPWSSTIPEEKLKFGWLEARRSR